MKHLLKLYCLLLLFVLAVSASAKSWQNVFPLQTTRAEILDLYGNPQIKPEDKSEYFRVESQTITIRWKQADCLGESPIIDEKLTKPDSLVYQITVIPDIPLETIDSYTSNLPKRPSPIPGFYYYPYVTNCIGNVSFSLMSCSSVSSEYGFGYSTSKGAYTALYFFPTLEEDKKWKEMRMPCIATATEKLD